MLCILGFEIRLQKFDSEQDLIVDAFEQWRYRRTLKISWTDKMRNDVVLKMIKEDRLQCSSRSRNIEQYECNAKRHN